MPPVIRPIDAGEVLNTILATDLFGIPPAAESTPIEKSAAPALNVKLKGVFSSEGNKPAYAIVNAGNEGDRVVKAGDEIKPGARLEEIYPRFIVVSRDGVREEVALDEFALAGAEKKPTQPRAVSQAVAPVQTPPAPTSEPFNLSVSVSQAKANEFSFSRRELHQALQDPGGLAKLGAIEVARKGVKITQAPSGSLTHKLGLKEGDVVTRVNGRPVSSNDDLLKLYRQFPSVTHVALAGSRDGKPMTWRYRVQQ